MRIDEVPRPITIEVDESHPEPPWLLLLTLLFVIGTIVLLVFYAEVPGFLSGFGG